MGQMASMVGLVIEREKLSEREKETVEEGNRGRRGDWVGDEEVRPVAGKVEDRDGLQREEIQRRGKGHRRSRTELQARAAGEEGVGA